MKYFCANAYEMLLFSHRVHKRNIYKVWYKLKNEAKEEFIMRGLSLLSLCILSLIGCSPSEDEEEARRLRRIVHIPEEGAQNEEIAEAEKTD